MFVERSSKKALSKNRFSQKRDFNLVEWGLTSMDK